MSNTESIGRPAQPDVGTIKGNPEHTRREMESIYGTVTVKAISFNIRRSLPHEFRSILTGVEERVKCNLCTKLRTDPIHHF
jgi:hypothetical protein